MYMKIRKCETDPNLHVEDVDFCHVNVEIRYLIVEEDINFHISKEIFIVHEGDIETPLLVIEAETFVDSIHEETEIRIDPVEIPDTFYTEIYKDVDFHLQTLESGKVVIIIEKDTE